MDGVSVGATVLTVDSTVGFGTTGTLIANYADGTFNSIKYTSKIFNSILWVFWSR